MDALCAISKVFLVDAKHLSEPLVAVVDVAWMHLVENKVVTVVVDLAKLSLKLVEVDGRVITERLLLLFLQSVLPLLLGVLDASLARFTTWLTTVATHHALPAQSSPLGR